MPTLNRLLPALTSLLLWVGGLLPGLAAQDLPSKKEIRAQIEAVQKGPAASTQKAEAIRFYEKALADLQAAETLIGERADFLREVKAAPDREKSLSLEIVAGSKTPKVEAPEGASIETLRRRANDAEATRRDLEKLIGSYDRRKSEYGDRLKQIAKRRSELEGRIEGLKAGGAGTKGTGGIVEKASGLAARCELEKLGREDARLLAEREALESRMALLPKEHAAARLRLESAKAAEEVWQALERQALEKQSRASAEKAKVLSRQGLVQRFADLKAIARKNEEWAKERGERLIPEKDELQKEKGRVRSRSQMLRRRFAALRKMIGEVGLNNSTVEMIRKEADNLPGLRQLERRKSDVQSRIAEVFLQSYTVERVLEDDGKKREQALIDAHKDEVKGLDALMLPIVAHSLIEQQEANAIQISNTLNETLTGLWSLDNELSVLLKTTSEFGQYLQERILWVPSIPRERLFDFHGLGEAAAWVLAPNQWGEALSVAWAVLMDDLGAHVLPFLLFWAIVLLTPHLRRRLLAVGGKVSKPREDRYLLTWQALLFTILLGLPPPLLAWGLESVLRAGGEKDSFSAALGSASASLATFLLMLSIMVQAVRPGGLCEVHFKWPAQGVEVFQRSLRRFFWLVLPLFLLAELLNNSGREDWTDGLGRIVFVLAAGLYSLFLFRSFRPSGSLLRPFLIREPERWYSKNARALYLAVSGAPILFILLALLGYLLTARRLAHSYHMSLWAFALVLAGFSLAQRWVRLSVKKAAIRATDERQARLVASEEQGEEIEFEESEVEKLDIEAVRTKTSQLFRAIAIVAFLMAGLSIWADVLPALKMFERVQLMPRLAILDGAGGSYELPGQDLSIRKRKPESGAERKESRGKSSMLPSAAGLPEPPGTTSAVIREGQRRLTLMQLLLFLVSAGFTVLGVRNLPTLVEILLLRRMQLDPGARVAFRTLTQYLVLGIGIVSMAGSLGIHWDDLQWLVAALTFGLAFGLQEIFANFISGLILLFERPIRVGDIVTIGQTSGTVTKVRLRATLIRDFDKKELLVPNKEFITQRLVNWTLSDTVVRIKLPVAVTMDADVPKVRSILEEVAAKAEDALEDPPPRVLCTGIDEGVIRFELWLFTNDRTNRPGLKDKMFSLIRSRFEEEGVEIAKPQRELFVHKGSDQLR